MTSHERANVSQSAVISGCDLNGNQSWPLLKSDKINAMHRRNTALIEMAEKLFEAALECGTCDDDFNAQARTLTISFA